MQGKLSTIFVGDEFTKEKLKIYTMFWSMTFGYLLIVIVNCFMLNPALSLKFSEFANTNSDSQLASMTFVCFYYFFS